MTHTTGGLLCAICAAPVVLGRRGYLVGKTAVCFPGFEKELTGAEISHNRVVRDGKMHPGEKYRGRYEHYLKHYIADVLADDSTIDFKRAFITHSPSEEGLVRFAIDTVKSYGLFREVLETTAGCTVCCHCGPDTLGILFMRKSKD